MTINTHLITVIIPDLNGKKFLGICLDSIYRQTLQNFLLIVEDNSSVNRSIEFVRDHYTDIQVIEFQENKGFGAAINEGIRSAKSKYICQ